MMKKLAIFVVALALLAAPAGITHAAAFRPGVMTEVEAELQPPNEVTRELHPDRYKGRSGGGDPSRIPDYGRTPTY